MELIRNEIQATLPHYLESYDYSCGSPEPPQPRVSEFDLGGLHYKLLAIVLLVSSLELHELAPDIITLTEIAIDQYEASLALPEMRAFTAITAASLYNVTILGAGLYGTSAGNSLAEKLPSMSEKWKEEQMVDFSARATEFQHHAEMVGFETKPDKEYITVRYFETLTDEEYEELLRFATEEIGRIPNNE